MLTKKFNAIEYAAAFFLLGDSLTDAVNVCLHQLKDLQLAVAIARVYEGDDHGPVLQKLLREDVLSLAAQEGNRWLASWAFWMLGHRDMAVRALIVCFASSFFYDFYRTKNKTNLIHFTRFIC